MQFDYSYIHMGFHMEWDSGAHIAVTDNCYPNIKYGIEKNIALTTIFHVIDVTHPRGPATTIQLRREHQQLEHLAFYFFFQSK